MKTTEHIMIATALMALFVIPVFATYATAQNNPTSNQTVLQIISPTVIQINVTKPMIPINDTVIPVQTPQITDTEIPNWMSKIIHELRMQLNATQSQIHNLQTNASDVEHEINSHENRISKLEQKTSQISVNSSGMCIGWGC